MRDHQHIRTLEDLNSRFQVWLDSVYHRVEHGALETTPLQRWQRDIEQIRQVLPSTDLRRLFSYRLDRLVRRDSTFLVHRRFTLAPTRKIVRDYRGKRRIAQSHRGVDQDRRRL